MDKEKKVKTKDGEVLLPTERKSDEGSARCRVRVYGRGIRGDLLLEHGGAVSHRVLTVIGEEGQVK